MGLVWVLETLMRCLTAGRMVEWVESWLSIKVSAISEVIEADMSIVTLLKRRRSLIEFSMLDSGDSGWEGVRRGGFVSPIIASLEITSCADAMISYQRKSI